MEDILEVVRRAQARWIVVDRGVSRHGHGPAKNGGEKMVKPQKMDGYAEVKGRFIGDETNLSSSVRSLES